MQMTPTVAVAAPSTLLSPAAADWQRALAIAVEHHLVAYRIDEYRYAVPSYSEAGREHIVTFPSERMGDSTCDCQAFVRGFRHGRCSHRAVAIFARRNHIHAVRPAPVAVPVPTPRPPFRLTPAIRHEMAADLLFA